MRADLALLRTTTFRLALAQAGVVLGFVVVILIYVYFATVGQLDRDSDVLADQEYAALERAYGEGGIRRLNQEVVERAALQGPFLYVLAEGDGRIISGDFERFRVLLSCASSAGSNSQTKPKPNGAAAREGKSGGS